MAARSNAWVCGRSLAGITGSNPAEAMDVCLLWFLCVLRLRSLWRVDHSSRGVVQSVCVFVSLSVIMCNSNPLYLQWVGRWGQTKKGKNIHKQNADRNVLCSQMHTVCVSSRTGNLCFNHIHLTNVYLRFMRVCVALLVLSAILCILYNQRDAT
jgi:hypothetical protein